MDEEVELELCGYFKKKELEALFAGDSKLPAYLQFCLWLPTPRLRGWACARAERIAHCALKQRSAAAWNLFFRAVLTAHKAMDVLKHYKAESLVKAMDEVGQGKPRSSGRPPQHESRVQRPQWPVPALRRHSAFEAVETWLDDRRLGTYGAVWLPRKTVELGEEAAGEGVGSTAQLAKRSQILRAVGHQEAHSEIAGFIAHKLVRRVGEPAKYLDAAYTQLTPRL